MLRQVLRSYFVLQLINLRLKNFQTRHDKPKKTVLTLLYYMQLKQQVEI